MQQFGEPTHSYFGTPLSEWLSRVPNELPTDAVGLWQVIPTLTHHFGLTGTELERAARVAVIGLLSAGAVPVQGAKDPERWTVRTDLIAPGDRGVDLVIEYWHKLGREPDVSDLWFALPSEMA